jgi:hypothetical protein
MKLVIFNKIGCGIASHLLFGRVRLQWLLTVLLMTCLRGNQISALQCAPSTLEECLEASYLERDREDDITEGDKIEGEIEQD